MTRGQEDNSVRVVTETRDVAEARDILEGIMTSDRADVPAIAQRRQLAQQDRQPARLQPRCEVPEWFDTVRREAAADYRQARHALEDSEAKRQPLTEAVDAVEQRLEEADVLCVPFDADFQKAQYAVKQAETERRVAERKLDESGIRGRRQLRAEHADAVENLTVAERQLARTKEMTTGPTSARTKAREIWKPLAETCGATIRSSSGATYPSDSRRPRIASTPSTPGVTGPSASPSTKALWPMPSRS